MLSTGRKRGFIGLSLAAFSVIGVCVVLVAGASASTSPILVREVFPGSVSSVDSAFIELQMQSPNQQVVSGKRLEVWGSGGGLQLSYTFPSNVPNGTDQASILIGDTTTSSEFGVTPDFVVASLSSALSGAGGAVCFIDTDASDCVAWGSASSFSPPLPDAVGNLASPSGGITSGNSLTRLITRGCATFLDSPDDSGDSATDFDLITPTPRRNATAPTEVPCEPIVPTGLPPVDAPPVAPPDPSIQNSNFPETEITKGPPRKAKKRKAAFEFGSSRDNSTFRCKLDRKRFRSCSSPAKFRGLSAGTHKFRVVATDMDGNVDPTVERFKWRVGHP